MFVPTDSVGPTFSNFRLVEQALRTMKQRVATHVEHESRLQRLYAVCQEKWLSQCEQLRIRIETLEARLAPWMTDHDDGPRLAVIPQHEDVS